EKAARWWVGMDPVEAGELLYNKRGCNQCHSIDGAGGIGPTFKGSFGARRGLVTGDAVTMDENYIRESILNPRAKIVAGFDPVMPTFQGRFKDEELQVMIAYIKSLSE
ncbi:MAG: cytochrome c, partial [Gemmatimonadetes bacterium]|nr:cytochrome c [Gemmatimonadota bacterium]